MQIKENTNVVQSNILLENRPKFTIDETRLFLTIIASVNKDDEDFTRLEIPVSEFVDLWGVESNAAYRKIKEALRGLVRKEFFVEGINPKNGKNCFLSMSYVSMATYMEGEGYAIVEISQAFKPYLLDLKKNYTKYILKNILSLPTVNAIRNYELMKQYEKLGKRIFTVDEYKAVLHIDDKYSRNTDLRVNVIEPACREINANTDITVTYQLDGRGQKAKIVFTIAPKNNQANPLSEDTPEPETPEETPEPKIPSSPDDPTDFELDLLEAIPEEVHKGEVARVRAILDVANRYIISESFLNFCEPDDSDDSSTRLEVAIEATQAAEEARKARVLNAINTYTTRDYNVRKKNIKNPNAHYSYYLAGFDGWLTRHQY